MKCADCPKKCGADRERGEIGLCGGGYNAVVAKSINEFAYEEPCLGESVFAVFFGGCALRCAYCQNYEISRGTVGREYDDRQLAALFDGSTLPIDLVTPSHFLCAIERAVALCEREHKFIYNTSGYETENAVSRAAAFSSIFLTDIKYADPKIAKELSGAADYPQVALKAAAKMRELSPDVWKTIDGRRILERGVVVRHLVLPDRIENSIKVLEEIARTLGTDTIISLMSQFTPNGKGEPSSRLRPIEYKIAAEHAVKLGFNNGYFQRLSSADSRFTPNFT